MLIYIVHFLLLFPDSALTSVLPNRWRC